MKTIFFFFLISNHFCQLAFRRFYLFILIFLFEYTLVHTPCQWAHNVCAKILTAFVCWHIFYPIGVAVPNWLLFCVIVDWFVDFLGGGWGMKIWVFHIVSTLFRNSNLSSCSFIGKCLVNTRVPCLWPRYVLSLHSVTLGEVQLIWQGGHEETAKHLLENIMPLHTHTHTLKRKKTLKAPLRQLKLNVLSLTVKAIRTN